MTKVGCFIIRETLIFYCCIVSTFSFTSQTRKAQTNSVNYDSKTKLFSATLETPPLAPLTAWGAPIEDVVSAQKRTALNDLEFAPTIHASDVVENGDELTYFRDHSTEIKQAMVEKGAVIFRGFELMKSSQGFCKFYDALGMKVCLDPLHSVSARPTIDDDGKSKSPVYEAVNKESRKNFFIGMHNEFVGTRAPRAAAFVCFKAAPTGGEFLIADGRAIFRDLDPNLMKRLYERKIRYSVMELPFFDWVNNFPSFTQKPMKDVLKFIVSSAINAKVDFEVDLQWIDSEIGSSYDADVTALQARAPRQPPVVLHPITGEPTWFCNVHSHSSVLRKQRESIYGEERFEDGASRINKSDMFFGDDGNLSPEDLKEMDAVTMKHIQYVKMAEGDVVLLDNYQCMHGRNVFDGTRKHGVAWFEGWSGEEEMAKMYAATGASRQEAVV